MDDELCLAPQLCIRCRSYGHVVVSNADACTCPDDETCPHNKNVLKKKTNTRISTAKVDGYDVRSKRKRDNNDDDPTESDDDDPSSSSSSCTSSDCTTTSESDSDSESSS